MRKWPSCWSISLLRRNIIVLRVLGRLGSVPGFADLVRHAKKQGLHLIAISGTGEPDPELAAASTVSSDVLHQVQAYFQAGGSVNMAQLLRYLSDHFLLTGFGFEPAVDLPEHGIYHPDLSQDAEHRRLACPASAGTSQRRHRVLPRPLDERQHALYRCAG